MDAEADVRLMCCIRRDMQERGRSIESIPDQYERAVRPMHLEYMEPAKREADVILPRGGHNRVAIEMVLVRIEVLLQEAGSTAGVEGIEL